MDGDLESGEWELKVRSLGVPPMPENVYMNIEFKTNEASSSKKEAFWIQALLGSGRSSDRSLRIIFRCVVIEQLR